MNTRKMSYLSTIKLEKFSNSIVTVYLHLNRNF